MHLGKLQRHHLIGDLAIGRAQRRELGRGREIVLAGSFSEQSRALGKQGQIVARKRPLGRAQLGRGNSISTSPARTCWPSRTWIAVITPPSRCWTLCRFPATAIVPAAWTPASSGINAAQPRNRTKNALRSWYPGGSHDQDRRHRFRAHGKNQHFAHAAFSVLFCGPARRLKTAQAGPMSSARPCRARAIHRRRRRPSAGGR